MEKQGVGWCGEGLRQQEVFRRRRYRHKVSRGEETKEDHLGILDVLCERI